MRLSVRQETVRLKTKTNDVAGDSKSPNTNLTQKSESTTNTMYMMGMFPDQPRWPRGKMGEFGRSILVQDEKAGI